MGALLGFVRVLGLGGVAALAGCGGGSEDIDAGVDAAPRPPRTVTGRMQIHLIAGPGDEASSTRRPACPRRAPPA